MRSEDIKLPPDYHTHSALCRHAVGRPCEYLETALTKGIPGIAFTDHCPAPGGYNPEHRMEESEFSKYREWVAEAQEMEHEHVLFGIEADYHPGCEEYLRPWLAAYPFDIVLGSVHYLDYWGFDSFEAMRTWEEEHVEEAWTRYFELMHALVKTGLYDVIAHFDLPKKYGHRPPDVRVRELVLPILDSVEEQGMALEINISGVYHPINEMYPSPQILSWMRERAIPITFGSDAHRPEHVGSNFEQALRLAKDAGFTESLHFRGRTGTPHPLP